MTSAGRDWMIGPAGDEEAGDRELLLQADERRVLAREHLGGSPDALWTEACDFPLAGCHA
jgi:hypothetical protein